MGGDGEMRKGGLSAVLRVAAIFYRVNHNLLKRGWGVGFGGIPLVWLHPPPYLIQGRVFNRLQIFEERRAEIPFTKAGLDEDNQPIAVLLTLGELDRGIQGGSR